MSSGQTLAIKGHRLIDGDRIVLELRKGGEVTCDKTLIEKILPDEVPFHEPEQAPVATADPLQRPSRTPMGMGPYGEIITSVAQAHGVDPLLVRALIQVESGYRPTATSHKGAMGLMQLMPSTARVYKVRNPYDPQGQHRGRREAPEIAARSHSGRRRTRARRVQRRRGRREEVQRDPSVPGDTRLRQPHPVASPQSRHSLSPQLFKPAPVFPV